MKTILKLRSLTFVLFVSYFHANGQIQSAQTMLKNPVTQEAIFKAISGDEVQMRKFQNYLLKQKKTAPIIGKKEIMIGDSVNLVENDSIEMKRYHGEY